MASISITMPGKVAVLIVLPPFERGLPRSLLDQWPWRMLFSHTPPRVSLRFRSPPAETIQTTSDRVAAHCKTATLWLLLLLWSNEVVEWAGVDHQFGIEGR
jgi:hypothetical protein